MSQERADTPEEASEEAEAEAMATEEGVLTAREVERLRKVMFIYRHHTKTTTSAHRQGG